MDTVAKILVAFILGGISYWWFLRRRYRTAADSFKQRLLDDIANYRSPETTLSAVVLTQYPEHNKAFEKFLVVVPRSKRQRLIKQWTRYTEIHDWFHGFGVFGVVMAEAPHPDIEPTQEHVEGIERKRKGQILQVLEDFIESL